MHCEDCIHCQEIEGPLDLPTTVYIVTCMSHPAQLFYDVPDSDKIPFDTNGERYTPYLTLNVIHCPFYVKEGSQPRAIVTKERIDLSMYQQVVAEPEGFGG